MMKIFTWFFVILLWACAGCSGFQYRLDQPLPTLQPTHTQEAEVEERQAISNLASLPPPTLFATKWNNPDRYLNSLRPSQKELLPGWLPRSEYLIDVKISQDLKSIEGSQEILVFNTSGQDMEEIVLHNYPALFGSKVLIENVEINHNPQTAQIGQNGGLIQIPLPTTLLPGEAAVLSLSFSYKMPEEASSNYLIFGNTPGLVTLAHFYPMLAVPDGALVPPPNYGDVTYSEAALYQVRVHAAADLTLVASGTETSKDVSSGQQTSEFVIAPARDFYLAAGKGMDTFETTVDDIRVTCISWESEAGGCQFAAETAGKALLYFNDVIGPYPYAEFDVISTHTQALGVEYPGVIAINQELMSLDRDHPDFQQSKYLSTTVVHEVGHQWFYNLIGNDQVNEPWLDESTTQYITYLYFLSEAGQGAGDELLQSFQSRVERVEDTERPIGLPVSAYNPNEYSAFIYGKGPLFFHEIEKQNGLEAMHTLLTSLYQQYSWENMQTADMEESLEASCSCELDPMFIEWIQPTSN